MFFYIIPAIILVFLAVVVIRTLAFKSQNTLNEEYDEVSFDKEKAISSLASLVRCKTISRYSHEEEDEAEFQKLEQAGTQHNGDCQEEGVLCRNGTGNAQ